jgi:hypothetical protein
MKSFKLVNPLIVGSFNTDYTAETGLDAANQFWNDFSTHITGNLPNIYVTLQEGGSQNLYHYNISEKINRGTKTTEFTISEHNVDLSAAKKNKFLNGVKKYETKINAQISRQTGGDVEKKPEKKRYKDKDSSSSSSDSDDYYNFGKYRRLTQPITMFYYTPLLYNVNSIFLPTFNVPLTPYVKLYMPMF